MTEHSPVISVIVPVYNTEKYLKKCVNSILGQTFSDFELILIDDGSTDKSPKICDDYAKSDSRVSVIHKENAGQGVARNVGIKKAKGEYLSFIDSDDYIDQDFLENLYKAIIDTDSDIALSDMKAFDGKLSYQLVRFDKEQKPSQRITLDNHELMQAYLQGKTQPGFVEKLYKKALFDDVEFPSLRAREDIYIMHLILCKCKKAVHTGESKYTVLIRSSSTEHCKFNENKLVLIDAEQRIFDFVKENYPDLFSLALLRPEKAMLSILEDIISAKSFDENKTLYEKISQDIISGYESKKEYIKAHPESYDERIAQFVQSPNNFRSMIEKKIKQTAFNRKKAILRNFLVKCKILKPIS